MIHTQNESGRSLLEMLAVVSVMGVLAVGAISGIRFGTTSMQVASTYDLIENTAAGIIDIYSWNRTYPTGASAAANMSARIINSKVCEDCKPIPGGYVGVDLPWGDGPMEIRPADANHFVIELPAMISQDVCIRLKNMRWNYVEWDSEQDCMTTKTEKRVKYVTTVTELSVY